jgi:hypothetical protein
MSNDNLNSGTASYLDVWTLSDYLGVTMSEPMSRESDTDGYQEISIGLNSFNFLDKKLYVMTYGEEVDYIKRYLVDIENDIYDTRDEIIKDYIRFQAPDLSESSIDWMFIDRSRLKVFRVTNCLDKVDEQVSEIVEKRKLRKEREDKINDVLSGKK